MSAPHASVRAVLLFVGLHIDFKQQLRLFSSSVYWARAWTMGETIDTLLINVHIKYVLKLLDKWPFLHLFSTLGNFLSLRRQNERPIILSRWTAHNGITRIGEIIKLRLLTASRHHPLGSPLIS